MTLPVGSRLGPYEILAPLGSGGMGEVYRARDARLGGEIAIKVLPVELSSDAGRLKRFEKEARSASALNHPNIVTIYEVGSHDANSYIAMELVEGKTLRELLLPGLLPMKRALPIATQVAEGLARAHEAGIVHRDLKPENLMVTRDGLVKILDFGLAKLISTGEGSGEVTSLPTETGTEAGVVLGTVGYMSPEQASGQPADHRSDQFSFGSILYEIACGRRAFQKKTTAETLTAIIREDPEPVGKLRPEAPPPLRWIVERCLAKDPEERYVSTRDLARDLASVRDHVSDITSAPEQAFSLGPSPLRRLRRSTVLASALLLLLVGAVAGWLVASKQIPRTSAPTFQRLTFRTAALENARFTPDGQTIVYGAALGGEPRGLYAVRPESPESRSFGMDADILAISRSGEMAVLINEVGPFGTLARVPFAGGTPRPTIEHVPYAGADFSSGGEELAIVRGVGGRVRLEFPVGKVLYEGEQIGSPRFSPGGDQIAFFDDDSGSVMVVGRTGGPPRALVRGFNLPGGAPCWSLDGKEVWFTGSSEPGKPSGLHAVDRRGKLRLVAQMPGELELDDISRDGHVLLAHHSIINGLWGSGPGDSAERDLTWLDWPEPFDLTSDGKAVLFNEIGEAGGRTASVYLRKMDGSPAVRLGEGRGLALSTDGSTVLVKLPDPAEGLRLIPTGTGEPRTLPLLRFEEISNAVWLPEGKSFLVSAREPRKNWRIHRVDLPDGKPRPVSPEGFAIPYFVTGALSPDGRFLLAAQSPGNFVRYPVAGGTSRPIAGLAAREVPIGWTSDGRTIFVSEGLRVPIAIRAVQPVKTILRLDPDTGRRVVVREIRLAEAAGNVNRIVVAPDGRTLAYGLRRGHSQLYVVAGLR